MKIKIIFFVLLFLVSFSSIAQQKNIREDKRELLNLINFPDLETTIGDNMESGLMFPDTGADEEHFFEIDDRKRSYYLFLPENLQENAPLVFVLHGYGGTAKRMIKYSKMNLVADQNCFAVCYPQGVLGDDNNNSWNAGYSNPDIDDVKFLSALSKHLQKQFKLSNKNTFCTGISNGADMCYVLACQSPDVFSAVAPVAGCMMESTFKSCKSANPVPVFEIHGTADSITYWDGDADYSEEYGGYMSVTVMIDFWSKKNRCTEIAIDTLPNINFYDNSYVVSEKYVNGINNNEVWLYKVVGGTHNWPGTRGNRDIIAAEEIWGFFKRFVK